MFPGGPYLLDGERAQVLRGSMPSKTEGVVGGSCWLVRKGERRLTINLQVCFVKAWADVWLPSIPSLHGLRIEVPKASRGYTSLAKVGRRVLRSRIVVVLSSLTCLGIVFVMVFGACNMLLSAARLQHLQGIHPPFALLCAVVTLTRSYSSWHSS